jgi:hypothetical protein
MGSAANPISRSGRRPQVFARRPAHGAIIATITCGTMINAETISEENGAPLYTSDSPASGSIDALATWKLPANMTRPRSVQTFQCRARGGALRP